MYQMCCENHNDYQAVQCKKIKIIIEARAESSYQQRDLGLRYAPKNVFNETLLD